MTSSPATMRAVRLSAPALWPAASGLGAGVQVSSAAAARSRDAAERGADGEEVRLGRRCAVRVGTSLRVVGEHIGARRSGVRGCDRAGVRRGCRGHGGTEDEGEHARRPGAPDDMTGIFRPHLGDADRATSVAAAGVCLLGLAFGDAGKFLQAGGHVLV